MVNVNDWKTGTQRAIIRDLLRENGMDTQRVFDLLKGRVGVDPFVFSKNGSSPRVPYPIVTQIVKLRYRINEVAVQVTEFDSGTVSPTPAPVVQVKPDPDPDPLRATLEKFDRELKRIRRWVNGNVNPMTDAPFDAISNRPGKYGKRLLEAGVPLDAVLYAMACHWSPDSRRAAGIPEVDQATVFPKSSDPDSHMMRPYIERIIGADVFCYIWGPAGTGKSYLLRQIAREWGMRYGECPMTAGATPSWLTGAYTLDGYKTRPLMECYEKGGIFNFEEMDAPDPSLLVMVNNLLESDSFFNPVTGEEVERHKDFRPVGTGNTLALGADPLYNTREAWDFSTRDRTRMGTVRVEYDEELETHLLMKGH
jgi:hypothetical protein